MLRVQLHAPGQLSCMTHVCLWLLCRTASMQSCQAHSSSSSTPWWRHARSAVAFSHHSRQVSVTFSRQESNVSSAHTTQPPARLLRPSCCSVQRDAPPPTADTITAAQEGTNRHTQCEAEKPERASSTLSSVVWDTTRSEAFGAPGEGRLPGLTAFTEEACLGRV